jgi:hypothetical protein
VKRLLIASLLMPACNWVTQSELDERLPQLDDDQDGFSRDGNGDSEKVDCDDTNPLIFPGADDTWYDGIDADCAENDDYDQDSDGYRSANNPDTSGAIGEDCDDQAATSYPGAPDIWYDGIDADCAGNNDYDQDGDGFTSDSEPDSSGELGQDCNDQESNIYPDADDEWYDGIDSNCLEDDDYDQDGDGFTSAIDPDLDGNIGDDCDDTEASSYPDADDAWYDGIDSNCLEDDDYDQDGDGFTSAIDPDLDGNIGDDCDDVLAEIYPGAMEDLSDLITDFDCDGAGDSVLTAWDSALTWQGIGSIHFGQSTDRVYLSSVSDSFTDTTGTTLYDLGVAVYWDITNLVSEPTGVEYWSVPFADASADRTIASGHDMIFKDTDLLGAMALIDSASSNRTARVNRLNLSTQVLDTAASSTSTTSDLTDITLIQDIFDSYRFIGCDATGNGAFEYLLTDDNYLDDPSSGVGVLYQETLNMGRPQSCEAQDRGDTEPFLFYRNESANNALELSKLDSSTNDVNSVNLTFQSQDTSVEVNDLDYLVAGGSEWLVITDRISSQVQVFYSLSTPFVATTQIKPDAVDIAWDSANSQLLVAWTDLSGGAHLAWANSSGFINSVTLNTSLSAQDIAVIAPENSDRVVVILTDGDNVEMALIAAP